MTIEVGIPRPDLEPIASLKDKARELVSLMQTTDDDRILDCVEDVLDLCCRVERILAAAKRQGS